MNNNINKTSKAPAHVCANEWKRKEAKPIIPRIIARIRAVLLRPALRKTQIAATKKNILVIAFNGSDQNDPSILSQYPSTAANQFINIPQNFSSQDYFSCIVT